MTIDELKKCLTDKKWRLNNLYCIVDRDGNRIPYRMNWAQEDFFNNKHTRNIILKARQLGFSTHIKVEDLDAMLFEPGTSCGTTADNMDNAKKLLAKVAFNYENLHPYLKQNVTKLIKNSATAMEFANGSKIDVGVSMRSDTKQRLHISELGKISVRTPDKAAEIRSGTLNTVSKNGEVTIESTAEGMGGLFYDMVQEARKNKNPGQMDFKLFFYPWFMEPTYVLDEEVAISPRLEKYFTKLAVEHNIHLTPQQKAWYVKKEKEQGEAMKKEFPSYIDEAFEQSTDGVVYARQLQLAYDNEQIGGFNLILDLPVYVAFDLGHSDNTAIITFQVVNNRPRILWFDEANHELLPYYVDILIQRRNRYGFSYGKLFLPHDGKNNNLMGNVADGLRSYGFDVVVMPRDEDEQLSVYEVKRGFHNVDFNKATTEELLKHLGGYRYEWNEALGVWKAKPRHDEHSHAADVFRYMLKATENYLASFEQDDEYEQQLYRSNRDNITGY